MTMYEKTLWLMVGLPGSGKTSVAKYILIKGSGWRYISRDNIRMEFLKDDDEDYFAYETSVFDIFTYRIKEAFKEEGIFNVIADATHLNWPSRRKLLHNLNLDHKVNIIPVVMTTPFDIAKERNNKRNGRACVPEKVLSNMNQHYTDPCYDPFHYTAIMHMDNT